MNRPVHFRHVSKLPVAQPVQLHAQQVEVVTQPASAAVGRMVLPGEPEPKAKAALDRKPATDQ